VFLVDLKFFKENIKAIEFAGFTFTIIFALVGAIMGLIVKQSTDQGLFFIILSLGVFGLFYIFASFTSIESEIHAIQPSSLCSEATFDEWYKELAAAVNSAKKEIKITYHSPDVPSETGNEFRKLFFQRFYQRMAKNDVTIKWIVTIDSREKLDWVKSLILNKHNLANELFHVNFSSIDLEYEAIPQSFQIFDNKIFVFDMSKGYYNTKFTKSTVLISTQDCVVQQLERYFNTYWDRIDKKNNWLKDGCKINNDALEKLETKFFEKGV
jgi:hypothetical protein